MRQFTNGERVVFLGDSITHGGRYFAHVWEYYKKNFPDRHIRFFNVGISGGTLTCGLKFFADVEACRPDTVIALYGMNDCDRDALNDAANRESRLAKAKTTFAEKLGELYGRCQNAGYRLILCTPTPYDEIQECAEHTLVGCTALLAEYAETVKAFAGEHGLDVIDYYTDFLAAMKKEPGLVNTDRVHPTARGRYIMAKTLLAAQGLDLGDERPLSPEMEKWNTDFSAYQNLRAAEWLLNVDPSLAPDERIAAANAFVIGDVPWADYLRYELNYYNTHAPAWEEEKAAIFRMTDDLA